MSIPTFLLQRCFLRKSLRGEKNLTTSHKTQEALLLDQMRFMVLDWESLQLGSLSDPVMDVPVSKMYSACVPNDPNYLLCLYPRKLNTPLLTVTGLWRKGIGHLGKTTSSDLSGCLWQSPDRDCCLPQLREVYVGCVFT